MKIYKDVGPSAFNNQFLPPHHQQHQFPSFSIFFNFLLPGSQSSSRLTRSSFNSITFVKDPSLQPSRQPSLNPPNFFNMFSKLFVLALAAAPLVAAHGKIAVATGDAGGNGTALGIQGAVIPGPGSNKVTEPDTTVFKGDAADSCGRTKGVSILLTCSPGQPTPY